MRTSNMKNLLLIVISALVVAAGFFVVPMGQDNEKSEIPTSLIGNWAQVNGEPDATMTAEITGEAIQINMETRDSSSIYWLGSFDTTGDLTTTFDVESQGDQDAMALSLFGSGDPTKTFAYKDGKISYGFTIMGSTTTVYLAKK